MKIEKNKRSLFELLFKKHSSLSARSIGRQLYAKIAFEELYLWVFPDGRVKMKINRE